MIYAGWTRSLMVFSMLALFLSISPQATAARAEPLYTPLPIDVGPGFTRSEIREAVSDSLINSGWHAQKARGGEIRAFQARGRHMARIAVQYSSKIITFRYLGSERMNEQTIDGVAHIHGLYNTWVHDFENALKFRINQLALSHEHGLKAPVTEVKVRSRQRKKVIIKRTPGKEAPLAVPETTVTTVETSPSEKARKPLKGAVVHEVAVEPETKKDRVSISKEPAYQAPKQDVEIKTVETPTSSNAAGAELPPVDAKPARSRDLGELKW